MGGIVTKNFLAEVTHLVADFCSTQSSKFRYASKMKIPIIETRWIDESWRFALDGVNIDCTKNEFCEQFRTTTFSKRSVLTHNSTFSTDSSRKATQNNGQENFLQPIFYSTLQRVEYRDSTDIAADNFIRELVLSKNVANNNSKIPSNDLTRWEEESDLQSSVSYSKQAKKSLLSKNRLKNNNSNSFGDIQMINDPSTKICKKVNGYVAPKNGIPICTTQTID